jgi:cell division protein FtsQ
MKRIIKYILRIFGWLLLVFVLIAGLAFSSRETAEIKCSEIVIKYAGNSSIQLSRKELTKMVRSTDRNMIGKKLYKIDTEKIEAEVLKNKAVLTADAYKVVVGDSSGLKGVVALKVRHRMPVVRVISSQGNFYMDKSGNKIPVSVNYASDVPLITGNVSPDMAKTELLPFVEFIQHNKFWRAQIKQIHVTGQNELVLTTLVGNQLVEFGTTRNMEQKFRNLRAFYDQVLANNNWNKYDRINLKFDNQVIAKKNK